MRTLLSLLALLGLSLAAPPFVSTHRDDPPEFIYGGHRAYQGHFPFYVYLFGCGGSLITPKHVLTATHCSGGLVGTTVVMGLDDRENYEGVHGVQIRKIIRVEAHAEYERYSKKNDIAVLEVDEPFQLDGYVELINIKADDTELRKSHWATAIGFGMTDIINGTTSVTPRYLQYVYDPLQEYDQCMKAWSHVFWDKEICAGARNAGTLPGDSGGPLSMREGGKNYQIGVASYLSYEAFKVQDKVPAVFTRTASYCDWITEKTNGEFRCQ